MAEWTNEATSKSTEWQFVDAYVQKHGVNSWKDIFVKSPREIYENSGFIS